MSANKKTEKDKKVDLKKQYYFISGMPRAGSTLICNILSQNPKFHSSATSGIMDVMFGVRNQWDNLVEFKASPNPDAKLRVIRGILESYYADIEKPVIFDKSRGWLSLIGMAEEVLGHKIKIIVPVRDVRDVLASFEKLWRENSKTGQMGQESQNYFGFQTVGGRMETWLKGDQTLGLAYNRITDAIQRGYADRMLLVDFDDLTSNPNETFEKIYEFLGEDFYQHDFNNVEQVTWENDEVHGMKGLHDIRPKVSPMEPQWPKILGPSAEKYGRMNFWKS
jgi:sulfotransferase